MTFEEAVALKGLLKRGAAASSTDMAAASPVPVPAISPSPAGGKRGPAGLAPRTNYTRVNTGEPPAVDAGASAQKSLPPRGAEMLPKVAGEYPMGNMAGRPSLNELVKSAVAESARRVNIVSEANFQSKTASPLPKTASALPGDLVEKLASTLDYLSEHFSKEGADNDGKKKVTGLPPGVTKSPDPKPLPFNMGHSPTGPVKPAPTVKGDPTKLPDNMDNPAGFRGHMVQDNHLSTNHGPTPPTRSSGTRDALSHITDTNRKVTTVKKTASALIKERLGQKQASVANILRRHVKLANEHEDGDDGNLHGKAVAPGATMSGEGGGNPVGGAPAGPTNLIASVANAINFSRRDAYGNRKTDIGKYLAEPMMASSHDNVLNVAFEHANQAGPKVASAQNQVSGSVKTAAARALLLNLAQNAANAV